MRTIRKLYFQNSAGQRWGLNGDRGVYASGLSGFGMTLEPGFASLGGGFFSRSNGNNEPQTTIPFALTFTKSPYQTYSAFVNWLSSDGGDITIVYAPTADAEFCRDVSVNFLQKGELNAVGWLEVPCSFFCKTPWYLPSPAVIDVESTGADESKRYDYYYEDTLCYGEDSSSSMSVTIAGAGHIPGALDLTFLGGITNPRIRLRGNNSGKTYGVCSIEAILGSTDALRYSSRYENSYVEKTSASGDVTDLLDVLDLSQNPFFHVPVNEPCTVLIEADSPFTGRAELLVYYYYRSV